MDKWVWGEWGADSEQPLLPEAEGRKASVALVFLTRTSGQALRCAPLPFHADHIHGGEGLECGNVLSPALEEEPLPCACIIP